MRKLIKYLENYPGYFISKNGDIFSNKMKVSTGVGGIKSIQGSSLHKLKPTIYRGRLFVTLSNNGTHKRVRVHRLVAEAFIPNPDNKPQVNHKDGNPMNNKVKNLYWGTQKQNIADAKRHGTLNSLDQAGEKNPSSKLNNKKVSLIRLLYRDFKWSPTKIYKVFGCIYGVKKRNFYSIIQNNRWKHV